MRFRSIALMSVMLPLVPLLASAQAGRLVLPDFSALSKKASHSVDISLDPSLISLANGFLGADPNSAAVRDMISGVQGIYVRSYQFDEDGQYSKADVDAVRAQLVAPAWTPLVSTHDRKQHSDIDIFINRTGQRTEGMAIITARPQELTIVNIVGAIDLAKLAQLQGRFGVPVGLPMGVAATPPDPPKVPSQPGVETNPGH
jgi:Domain of unknown function (DUF4252)